MHGTWVNLDPPRRLTDWERRVVERLSPQATEEAIEGLRVIDHCGCGCASVGFANVAHVPVGEAEAADSDGELSWVMLFADREEQILATLDVIRPDGRPIRELPNVDQLSIVKTSAWSS